VPQSLYEAVIDHQRLVSIQLRERASIFRPEPNWLALRCGIARPPGAKRFQVVGKFYFMRSFGENVPNHVTTVDAPHSNAACDAIKLFSRGH
jgi:hypothetical protein